MTPHPPLEKRSLKLRLNGTLLSESSHKPLYLLGEGRQPDTARDRYVL